MARFYEIMLRVERGRWEGVEDELEDGERVEIMGEVEMVDDTQLGLPTQTRLSEKEDFTLSVTSEEEWAGGPITRGLLVKPDL
jgi:hypothetical protein